MEEKDVPGELGLTITRTFSVAAEEDDAGHEIVVKQEPPDVLLPPEVMEHEEEEDVDEKLFPAQVFPEDSEFVMQRAVSPPTYVDPSEQRLQELIMFYKVKYRLPDVTVAIENCDKIWNTMQMIKNLQGFVQEDSSDSLPKTSMTNEEPKLIPYQLNLGNNNKALPDFRFSVKSKKRLYHCVTCGKEFVDNQHLHQHAMQEHGIYVSPKRIYKPRADMSAKVAASTATSNSKIKINSEEEIASPVAIVAPQIQTIIPVQAMQVIETMNEPLEPMTVDDTIARDTAAINEVKSDELVAKVHSAKEKIKCILCKRVCTDIVYHMKGYHKVGCVNSIISQCKIVVDSPNTQTEESDAKQVQYSKNTSVSESVVIDINESLVVAVKKRKRNQPRWTIPKKKKYKSNYDNLPVQNFTKGPFKCLICLGMYKTVKSFSHHKKLHRIRGETVENFDPSKCRFLNSPLRSVKDTQLPVEEVANSVPTCSESSKIQSTISEQIAVPSETVKSALLNEDTNNSECSSMDTDNDNPAERPTCECGRSFRSSYTLFLHRAKCKRSTKGSNDIESGLGISIKIKKNKNDSYEVVPRNIPIEESYKEPSKDSDASSNDSGMASVDFNNQRVSMSEPQFTNKTHSFLRIQIAEDDEEVDIEDESSNHSNLTNVVTNLVDPPSRSDTLDLVTANPAQKGKSEKFSAEINYTVPSLISLCQKVLNNVQELDSSAYRCETCKTYFKTKTELMAHAKKMNHDVKNHCPCGKDFKNLKYYNMHVRRYHPALLKCSYCKTNFGRIEKYMEHECNVIEGPSFIEPIIQTDCLQCKTLVDLGEPFDKHMKTHMVDSTVVYHCYKCDMKFSHSHLRRIHFDKEHGFSLCQICGKLLRIDYIYNHEAYHDGLGYPCHTCRKAFPQKSQLKKHVQNTHEPLVNKVMSCMVCSKSLKLKHLKKHMSIHLHAEVCKKCNKCFKSDEQMTLEDHVVSDHPTDYPTLKCDTCTTAFMSDERFKEHCQSGSCKSDASNKFTPVQNATSN